MGGKDSAKANDKFSPLFWHKKFGTWQTGGYIVKEGDNLSSIAKNNNILLKDLISSNNIVDANKLAVGQKIIIPAKKTINPTYNSKQEYNISKGDTLYDISKKFNIGVSELKKHNDLKSDTILAGSKLYIPFGVNEQVRGQNKKAVTTFKDNSERDSNKVIQDFYKNKNEEYVVIDKKTGTLNNYKGNKLLSSINVGHGKTGEDIITGLGGVKNYSTGAGIFTIASNDEDVFVRKDKNNNKLYGDNIRGYKNEAGQVQGSFLHQVPNNNTEREKKLDDNDPSNNNFSQGCINCKKKDFTSVVSKLKPGTKLYILPQEKDNYFEVKNNKINFTTNKNKDIRGYNYTYDDKGNYLSPKVRDATYAPFDIPNKKSAIFDNRNTRLQQEILNKNKKQLMKDLNLDSDTYDVLAKQLIGHIKQETGSSYKADVGERFINNILDITDVTVPSVTYPFTDKKVFGKHSGKTYTSENSSRGDLQIRYNQIPKEILKKYNVNSPDDLDDLEKAIPIGMFLKKDGLAQVIAKRNKLNNLTKSNIYDFVPYQYNQAKLLQEKDTNPKKNKYVQNVLTYADTKQNNIWQTGPQKTKLTNYPYMKGSRPALSTSNGKSIEVLDGRTISMDNIYDADSVIVKGNEGKTFYKSKLKKYIK
jgi:LysM repeat protein